MWSVQQASYQRVSWQLNESPPPANIHIFKINNRKPRKTYELWSKFIIKTPQRRQFCCSDFFIVKFEHISHLFLLFLLTSNRILFDWSGLPQPVLYHLSPGSHMIILLLEYWVQCSEGDLAMPQKIIARPLQCLDTIFERIQINIKHFAWAYL